MPSTMIHLLLAYKCCPSATGEFFIGSITPDAVDIRKNFTHEDKRMLHFRDKPDRLAALSEFANSSDMNNKFIKGVILHLFFDIYWDKEIIPKYHAINTQTDWFINYRKEIGKAGNYIYHSNKWANDIWVRMMSTDTKSLCYSIITNEDIANFLDLKYEKHINSSNACSVFFNNSLISEYTDYVLVNYLDWSRSLT